eukprot:gene8157-biopygen10023
MHDLLHNLIGSSTERLASPLNVALSTAAYWSLHDKDRLFGANWNAYSVKWTGTSVVVPDHTDSTAITHAMQWAQQSARTAATPTLTLLVLPAYGKSGSEDGSVISGKGNGEEREASGPGIGAAVHIPASAQAAREAMTVAISCEYKDDDELKTVVNTINRAELAAIKIALEVAPQELLLGVLNGCCLLMLAASPVPVHIWKVKSHIGIVGNEKADRAAVKVATGEFYEYEQSDQTYNTCTPVASMDDDEFLSSGSQNPNKDEDQLQWRTLLRQKQ